MQRNNSKYTFLSGCASRNNASVLATLEQIIHNCLEVFFSKFGLIVQATVRFKPFPFVKCTRLATCHLNLLPVQIVDGNIPSLEDGLRPILLVCKEIYPGSNISVA
jgi:hypothetical protein